MRLALAVVLSGCSFIASTTPPGHARSCMPSAHPAHVDTAVVAIAATIDLLLAASTAGGCKGDFGCTGQALLGAAVTIPIVPFIPSAIYGYVKNDCDDAEEIPPPPQQPPQPHDREECLAVRRQILERLGTTNDPDERREMLSTLPRCEPIVPERQ